MPKQAEEETSSAEQQTTKMDSTHDASSWVASSDASSLGGPSVESGMTVRDHATEFAH